MPNITEARLNEVAVSMEAYVAGLLTEETEDFLQGLRQCVTTVREQREANPDMEASQLAIAGYDAALQTGREDGIMVNTPQMNARAQGAITAAQILNLWV